MAFSPVVLFLPLLLALTVWLITVQVRQRRYKLPPQVPGIPIFGNTFQVPTTVAALSQFALGLGKTYKDACTLKIGSQTWVVINSKRMYTDLLEKRPQYASRPAFPMVQDIMSGGKRIALMPYNNQWREVRKVMHGVLNSRQMSRFAPVQDSETKKLLWSYLQTPDTWFRANQHYTNSVIMAVVFGKTLSVEDPNLVDLLRQGEEMILRLRAAGSLVDAYPFLSKLPRQLQWWRKEGQYWLMWTVDRVYGREVYELVSRMENGDAPDCFGVEFLKATEKSSMDFEQKLFAMGTLMEAGSDTSRMTMNQTIAAAVLFPDWVARAREQLDATCGNAKRLPGWEDRSSLPYITATVKEALRWRPFIPLGVPHMLTKDDEYEGYKFPAGTVFTWNSYFMSQNEEEFEDPQRFYPDRFLDEDLDNVLKGNYTFGPGRRVCVGYNVAEKNIWIAIARLVYCFDFEQVEPLDPLKVEWTEFEHAPFPLRIKPRSAAHRELMERECAPL